MIPIVREFFRSLKERHELDVIIPELLTAMGYEVISRPMTGTRQYGADVAAVGIDEDGIRKLFLFVIKMGDLTRDEWDVGAQSVRPSLNEVRDAYLSGLAPAHKGLPVVVCITVGGLVRENVLRQVNGYMETQSRGGIEFRLWTGDTLTGRIVDGALREEVFAPELRSHLRRAAALVEEPEASFSQFTRLVDKVVGNDALDPVARVRILYLALWILRVWAREAGNLEAPYRASEIVVLRSWALLWPGMESDRSRTKAACHSFVEIVALHLAIWDELYVGRILPHAASTHALSYAVRSQHALDVNLSLFETLGRVAAGGLWKIWLHPQMQKMPGPVHAPRGELVEIAVSLARMIEANPVLCTPATEDQRIDIGLALMVLAAVPQTHHAAIRWITQMTTATVTCVRRGVGFPVVETDYARLIRLPSQPDPETCKELTAASIIYPLLAMFAHGFRENELVASLGRLQTEKLPHANFQAWVPNARSEENMWRGHRNGSALGSLAIGEDGSPALAALRRESDLNKAFSALSAVRLDFWPLLTLACRAYRFPPPPQLWLPLVEALRVAAPEEQATWRMAPFPMCGSVVGLRRLAMRSTSRHVLTMLDPEWSARVASRHRGI